MDSDGNVSSGLRGHTSKSSAMTKMASFKRRYSSGLRVVVLSFLSVGYITKSSLCSEEITGFLVDV